MAGSDAAVGAAGELRGRTEAGANIVKLGLLKSHFWLAHRNGRVCAESEVPMNCGNPYRRGSKSWFAFNASYAAASGMEARQGEKPQALSAKHDSPTGEAGDAQGTAHD